MVHPNRIPASVVVVTVVAVTSVEVPPRVAIVSVMTVPVVIVPVVVVTVVTEGGLRPARAHGSLFRRGVRRDRLRDRSARGSGGGLQGASGGNRFAGQAHRLMNQIGGRQADRRRQGDPGQTQQDPAQGAPVA